MNNYELYNKTAYELSEKIMRNYSTSFSIGTFFLGKDIRPHIYAIYGFVRLADEIVDTFHKHDKKQLLEDFIKDTYLAIERKISTNPILHSFQLTVNKFNIDRSLIDAFFRSMSFDLERSKYDSDSFKKYVYGSAEVVGLMCLKIFVNGDDNKYQQLVPYAKALGSAFQKVNFLRDLRHDYFELGRAYFPGIDFNNLTEKDMFLIFEDIQQDFDMAFEGIKMLPISSQLGVYVAYVYYLSLFEKLKRNKNLLLKKRIRINNFKKALLLAKAWFNCKVKKLDNKTNNRAICWNMLA